MMPWTDRAGRFSALKAFVLLGCCMPAVWIVGRAITGDLDPRPFDEAILRTGDWAIRFLWLSLAVTPLRYIANWPKLILVRRMLGVTAALYAITHLTLYATDLRFDIVRIASEIALRFYLTIGFVAVLGLSVLALTSTDSAIKRLGRNWNRLHSVVYLIAPLAVFHFFIQSKADVYEPTLMAGFLLLLMFCRLSRRFGFSLASVPVLLAIAVMAALGTAAIEYAWYGLATGVPPGRVLAANLQFSFSIRPAWWVLASGLALAVVGAARGHSRSGRKDARVFASGRTA
ncbi:MAG: sulfoxide reductase heme-binding subunit YedZ [Rhizobiaceae bacterium]|nr:sulfoxide reductase heme-binding subunit YedZ [Rhizobiaceae bacterium]